LRLVDAFFAVDNFYDFRFINRFSSNSTYLPQYSEMIKIRLQRHGAKHAPFYRMVVAPSQARRDGKFIEVLGTYNPQAHKREEELKLKIDRVDHWLGVGAQPTDTAKSLIRQGRMSPEEWLKRADKLAESKLKRKNKGDTAPSMEENAGEPAAEEKPAEEVPIAEEKPAEEEKKEEPVAEEPKAEEKPVEEAKEEAPAEEKKEEPKAEEAPAEEAAPAEEEAKEEEKAEEPAPEEKAEEEAPSEEEEKKDS
jgi:small subunit ribosomal protein S16